MAYNHTKCYNAAMRNDDLIPNITRLLRDAGHEGLHRLDWIRQVQDLYPDNPPSQSAVDRRFTDLIGHSSKGKDHPDYCAAVMHHGKGWYKWRAKRSEFDTLELAATADRELERYDYSAGRQHSGTRRGDSSPSERVHLYNLQEGICPGCGRQFDDHRLFDVDHILALVDGGEKEAYNRQLLCPYCNRRKARRVEGRRLTMAELLQANIAERFMYSPREAAITSAALQRALDVAA